MEWAAAQGGGSYGAVFLLGASSGVVAAPCGAPAFAVVLTWVAATQAGVMGFVYLFAFSLGMTAILVVVGVFSGSIAVLPRSGKWMVWMKRVSRNPHDCSGSVLFRESGIQHVRDTLRTRLRRSAPLPEPFCYRAFSWRGSFSIPDLPEARK